MMDKIYTWHGIDEHGMRISGRMQAEDRVAAKNSLLKEHISPLKIQRKFTFAQFALPKKIAHKHITDFSRQLVTLIKAGIPLLAALNIIKQSSEHAGLCILVNKIKQDIENGLTLSAALKKYNKYFSNLFCNLIHAGEQSGTLDIMLNNIANHQEKTDSLKRKITKALLYPTIILTTAIMVTTVLLLFVVPQFAKLFHDFGAGLPAYTRLVINLATIIKGHVLFIIILIISSIMAFKHMNTDRLLLKIPIIGKILTKAIIARFARTLAITFTAGLPLSEALPIIADTVNNQIYKQTILTIHEQVVSGQTITAAMATNSLFPPRAKQMIAIGEESGTLDTMLIKIAEYYENEVNYLVDNLNNLLEPTIMVILGILIGGLIIGMYLPIFRLGSII